MENQKVYTIACSGEYHCDCYPRFQDALPRATRENVAELVKGYRHYQKHTKG